MAAKSRAKPSQNRIEKAKQAKRKLAGHRPTPEESDDDDDVEWEFIYEEVEKGHDADAAGGDEGDGQDASTTTPRRRTQRQFTKNAARSEQRIIGARRGKLEYKLGDCVMLLNSEGREAWSGLITSFALDEDDVNGEPMQVIVKWFANPAEVPDNKRRSDELENEVYISAIGDSCPIGSIDGKATIMSTGAYDAAFTKGIPKKSPYYGKTFICRRGCSYRNGTFTPEFVWEENYDGSEQMANTLIQWVDKHTAAKTKRKRRFDDGGDFVLGKHEDAEEQVRTPKKRQKVSAVTPQKPRTPSKLFTPSHKRVVIKRPLEITPLGTRILSPSHVFGSPFQAARSKLHVSSVPDALPCREDEFATVYTHLESVIADGSGACIYISGTPGTGKTATVREVVAQLHAAVLAEELEAFKFVEINGMKVTEPHQSYALLWEALKGDRVSPSHALDLLDREFSHPSPRRMPCVVLMDELDQLVTKNQSVMYNFFNWPSLRYSKLIVLAVANTMDLPERTLSNKISSRLGLTRITFPGYTHDQLMKIIQSRLEGVPGNIVDPDAVQFASRKVAAVSGDARRALDICRRAVEIAEAESLEIKDGNELGTPSKSARGQKSVQLSSAAKPAGKVTISTVKKAINEATTSPLQQYLRGLPLAAKVLLAALLMRTRRTGVAESLMGDVLDEARRMAMLDTCGEVSENLMRNEMRKGLYHSSKPLKASRVLGMGPAAVDLMEAGIIGLEARKADRMGKVRLSVSEEDIKLAFKDDPEIKAVGFTA